MTIKKFTRRQTHWAKFLSQFNFIISYTVGKDDTKIDAFTRHLNDNPANDYDDR